MRLFLTQVLLGCLLSTASANVLVYNVNLTGAVNKTINYRLLDAAGATVNIEVFGPLPATTVIGTIPGTANEGANSVPFTGIVNGNPTTEGQNYGFRIIATKGTGHAAYTQLSNNAEPRFQFESPRGVAVNKDVNSPNFGLIYVGNTRTNAVAGGRTMQHGIYAVAPDATDLIGFADAAARGSVDWLSGTVSPYDLFFGPDNKVYITDWSDPHSGLWRAPENLGGTWEEVFTNVGRETSGLVAGVHGSISGVYVEPSGDGGYNVIWTDEDLVGPTTTPGDGRRDVFIQTIYSTSTLPLTNAPGVLIDENSFASHPSFDTGTLGIFVNDTASKIVRDNDGNLWVPQNRSGGTDFPTLMKINAAGNTMLWDSRTAGLGAATITDPFVGNQAGLVLSPDKTKLYVGTGVSFAVVDLSALYTDSTGAGAVLKVATGGALRDMDVDPAGNLYTVSNITERLKIYSPPGANAFTFQNSLSLPGGTGPTAAHDWQMYN